MTTERCWQTFEKNKPAPCLRIETKEKLFVVQYVGMVKGTLNEAHNQMSLYFSAVDVVVRGEKLLALFREIQRFNVDYIREGSPSGDDKVKIDIITVKEAPLEEKAGAGQEAELN